VKRFTLVTFLALVCVGVSAHATSICSTDYTNVTTFTPTGSSAADNLTTYCASVPPFSSDPTAARTSFLNTPGQQWLDTINWPANLPDGVPGNPNEWSISPLYGGPGGNPVAPDGAGGVNGTGYTWGSVPSDLINNPEHLALTSSFGTMPVFGPSDMMLTGQASTGNEMALTWDTSTTTAVYNGGLTDTDTTSCSWNDPNRVPGFDQGGYDPNCWTNGPLSHAAISGLGFDVQLTSPSGFIGPWTATFAIYGATPGCDAGGADSQSTVRVGTAFPYAGDCFDYNTGQMTDVDGNDSISPCIEADPDYAQCLEYSDTTVQLLGTVTINSDSNGDPAFFGFTTSDPYGIGALVMTGYTTPSSDSPDANFSIDEQTLLTNVPPTTPEPATLLLFGSGLLLAARRLRKQTTK
jgi:hypothetical protein